jgi:CheY-like chemotaxis protein/GGDEF domain-containing protein
MRGATQLRPGLWRLSASAPGEALDFNCYLLSVDGGFCLIDAGPAALGETLVRESRAIAPVSAIRSIVLLDEGAFSHTALGHWEAAGFGGEVVADWRVVAALAMGGVRAAFRDLREADDRALPEAREELLVLRPRGAFGPIALFHAPTGFLFTGRLGSSMGKDLPESCEDVTLRAQRQFMETFGYGPGLDISGLDISNGRPTLCPRFGSLVPEGLASALLELAAAPHANACIEAPAELVPLMREVDSLKSTNYELKEAMIKASDAALRDPASQLYGRDYADAFIQMLCEGHSEFSAAFVRIDRIKELNRVLGARAVDLLIKDLAAVIQEREPDGFLFRWTGPVLLLILEGAHALEGAAVRGGAFERLDGLRNAISAERRFVRPISSSIALVLSDELSESPAGGPFAALQALARERLKLLDRRGGNAVLDRSDFHIEDRSLVLALDANVLFLDFLVDYLEREGFRTRGAARGGEALELMDGIKPELVIADVSLPQFDAFQIRMRMRSSIDLHDIPFILMADVKSDEMIARAHSLGIFHVFEKPVSMVELVGVARSLLARSEDGA